MPRSRGSPLRGKWTDVWAGDVLHDRHGGISRPGTPRKAQITEPHNPPACELNGPTCAINEINGPTCAINGPNREMNGLTCVQVTSYTIDTAASVDLAQLERLKSPGLITLPDAEESGVPAEGLNIRS